MFCNYYNQNLRKLIVGFGSLFSNIEITHATSSGGSENIRVPVHYSDQEKFIQRLLQPSSISTGTKIQIQVPIISYVINNIVPDPSRRIPRMLSTLNKQTDGVCSAGGNQIKNQIPVNIGLNLFVYTRHTDDMLQIVEQIMPYFVPDHIIELQMNDVLPVMQIPIIMVSNNLTERYEGDLNSRRLNVVTFQFLAKSWIFGEVKNLTTINNTDIIPIVFDWYVF